MSRLKVFWPEEVHENKTFDVSENDQQRIIPFVSMVGRIKGPSLLDVVTRARTIHLNGNCRTCGSCAVDPIELKDGILNRNRLQIPGTATVVGFRCNSCGDEWPA